MGNGFAFKNNSSDDFPFLKVLNRKRPIYGGSNDSPIPIPGRHGTVLYPGELKDAPHEIECIVKADTMEELRQYIRTLKAWLYSVDRERLSYPDEPEVYYMAKIDNEIIPDPKAKTEKFTIVFRSEPLANGAEIEQSFTAGALVVNNPGTFEAMPLFQVIFTAIANEVKIELGGKFIRVIKAFAVNDVLEINTATGAVLLNSTRILDALDWQYSEFFTIQPGEWNIYITPTTGITATCIYKPRYL